MDDVSVNEWVEIKARLVAVQNELGLIAGKVCVATCTDEVKMALFDASLWNARNEVAEAAVQASMICDGMKAAAGQEVGNGK